MKTHSLSIIVFFVALMSCQQATTFDKPMSGFVIVNSKWEIVSEVPRMTDDVQSKLDSYNNDTTDDFLRLYKAKDLPELYMAPAVAVYVINNDSGLLTFKAENISRSFFVENISAWKTKYAGQTLYVDHVPKQMNEPWKSDPYSWYSMYVIDNHGKIQIEDHCGYLPDNSWNPAGIFDYETVDRYYSTNLYYYDMYVSTGGPSTAGWKVITHQIYVEPSYIN